MFAARKMIMGGGSRVPVIESYVVNRDDTGATSLVVSKPTGTVSGNQLLAICYGGNGGAVASSGWTSGGTGYYHILSKTAGGSEPSSYTFTKGSGIQHFMVCILRIPNGVLDVIGTEHLRNGSSGAINCPSVTSLGGLLIAPVALRNISQAPVAITGVASMDHHLTMVSVAGIGECALYTEEVAAGATGTRTMTPSVAGAGTGWGRLISIKVK